MLPSGLISMHVPPTNAPIPTKNVQNNNRILNIFSLKIICCTPGKNIVCRQVCQVKSNLFSTFFVFAKLGPKKPSFQKFVFNSPCAFCFFRGFAFFVAKIILRRRRISPLSRPKRTVRALAIRNRSCPRGNELLCTCCRWSLPRRYLCCPTRRLC